MHRKWFGDAYTYSHRALIHGVAPPDEWFVHPMLFSKIGGGVPGGGLETEDYVQFLGLEDAKVLRGNAWSRNNLVADVAACPERHLFLDPDTGIGLYRDVERGCVVQPRGPRRVSGDELVGIARGRLGRVVLVFDHSYLRVKATAREKVAAKLNLLSDLELNSAAVIVRESPCVCYVLVAVDGKDLVREKIEQIRARLHLPESHIVRLP